MTVGSKAYEEAVATDSPERLRELSRHRDKKVRVGVALNSAAPTDLLEGLVADKHHLVRYAVAQRPDKRAWQVALAAGDSDVRVILAQHQGLDDETLEALLTDPTYNVRQSLASSTRRSDIISRLARDESHHVRASVALNDCVSDGDLERLAGDRIAQVRAVVAQSRRLSADTVSRLGRDRSANVRYFVLEQHRDRLDLAEQLEDDQDEEIRELARILLQPRNRARREA